jgi:hypothetical protein
LVPKVNNDILEMTAGFDLFAAKWTWWLRHFISWGMAGLCLSIVLLSIVYNVLNEISPKYFFLQRLPEQSHHRAVERRSDTT